MPVKVRLKDGHTLIVDPASLAEDERRALAERAESIELSEPDTDEPAGQAPAQANAPAAPPPSFLGLLREFATGIAKGAASTVYHGGDAIRRAAGMERILDDPSVQAMITPNTPAERFGKGLEQAAEFLLPGRAVGAGATALSSLSRGATAGTLARSIGTAGLEGFSTAGIAAAQTGGDPNAMRNAGLTAAAFSGLAGAARSAVPAAQQMLRESAVKRYARAINPTTQRNKFTTGQVAQEMVDRGIVGGYSRLNSIAQENIQRLGNIIDETWASMPAGSTVEIRPIINSIRREISSNYVKTTGGKMIPIDQMHKQRADALNELKNTLLEVSRDASGRFTGRIDAQTLRSLRQAWDQVAAEKGAFAGVERAQRLAQTKVANAIRSELAQQHPNLARINKEFHLWKSFQDVVQASVLRKTGQQGGLGKEIATAAGAAMGGAHAGTLTGVVAGMTARQLHKLVNGPAWGTMSAIARDRIARALEARALRLLAAGGRAVLLEEITDSAAAKSPVPAMEPSR